MQEPIELIAGQSEETLSELLICRHLNGIKVINRPNIEKMIDYFI